LQPDQCRRCGAKFEKGSTRYIMILTFVADVDLELIEPKGNIEESMQLLLEEIERTPEGELMNQVYQKEVFVICTRCKEDIAANPFGSPPPYLTDSTQ